MRKLTITLITALVAMTLCACSQPAGGASSDASAASSQQSAQQPSDKELVAEARVDLGNYGKMDWYKNATNLHREINSADPITLMANGNNQTLAYYRDKWTHVVDSMPAYNGTNEYTKKFYILQEGWARSYNLFLASVTMGAVCVNKNDADGAKRYTLESQDALAQSVEFSNKSGELIEELNSKHSKYNG